jgi:hypothetical protein
MALHDVLQRLLLIGHSLPQPPLPLRAEAPARLAGLMAAVRPAQQALNAEATALGHRYRSAFWGLYLLSALAVLLAVLPVALGWAAAEHPLHAYALVWGLLEVGVIASVALLYRRGMREDWQGRWLAARAEAELAWYLPLAAALRGAEAQDHRDDWYAGLFGSAGKGTALGSTLQRLCLAQSGGLAQALAGAWQSEEFLRGFGHWACALLSGQVHYHRRTAARYRALLHRGHRLSAGLFVLTALAALLHLFWHAPWLLIATTSFPAFGAALHGALVQAEAHRLADASQQMAQALSALQARVEHTLQAPSLSGEPARELYETAYEALARILEEHQGWHMVVRPHHLPLA